MIRCIIFGQDGLSFIYLITYKNNCGKSWGQKMEVEGIQISLISQYNQA